MIVECAAEVQQVVSETISGLYRILEGVVNADSST